jgi:hypothetical protein
MLHRGLHIVCVCARTCVCACLCVSGGWELVWFSNLEILAFALLPSLPLPYSNSTSPPRVSWSPLSGPYTEAGRLGKLGLQRRLWAMGTGLEPPISAPTLS